MSRPFLLDVSPPQWKRVIFFLCNYLKRNLHAFGLSVNGHLPGMGPMIGLVMCLQSHLLYHKSMFLQFLACNLHDKPRIYSSTFFFFFFGTYFNYGEVTIIKSINIRYAKLVSIDLNHLYDLIFYFRFNLRYISSWGCKNINYFPIRCVTLAHQKLSQCIYF